MRDEEEVRASKEKRMQVEQKVFNVRMSIPRLYETGAMVQYTDLILCQSYMSTFMLAMPIVRLHL
jgi:hypothetical protein